MKIDEAIKLIDYLFVRRPQLIDSDYDAAIKLGKEALERIKRQRKDLFKSEIKLLPGETKD